ncbi:hypothetical protein DVA86_33045 [Streptomyces armeniacus]|uniref:Secreted protein n=1 Tax=Streptomyces armeniacus TaxID=83291 RepID=A0A345XYG1_9ACTN|nr:hypothetical protein [Streptomyces armeniacus]AXK36677.1 hypothetical protein DVA86_33045 [Streptomyces armeniacus]
MNVRRTMKARRALTAVAITTGLVLTVAGCSGGGDDDKPDSDASAEQSDQDNGGGGGPDAPDDNEVLAEVKGGDDLTLTFNSAKREEGGFVTVTGKLTNNGSGLWLSPGWSGDEEELAAKNKTSMAGAKLTDKSGKKRYYILRDTEGRCLCTSFSKGIQGGDTETWYAQFPAPPKGNNTVDFQIADMPPATIKISDE